MDLDTSSPNSLTAGIESFLKCLYNLIPAYVAPPIAQVQGFKSNAPPLAANPKAPTPLDANPAPVANVFVASAVAVAF